MLRFEGLTKRFGAVVALDGLSFQVRPGEIFGFVGANGAGKTTAMHIALGVLAADRGAVTWQDRPLDLDVRRKVGYMPEERGLYPRMRVGEQLVHLARLHGVERGAAERSADLWMRRLGVESRARDDVQKLSLGNQQRVQLAAALVHDPELLVLDEPFSGLDPIAVDVMSRVLREQAGRGVPVLFSSHQLELVERLCDRVGIIRSGQMVAAGTIEELRAGAPQRWSVTVDGAVPGWAAAVLHGGLGSALRVVSEDGPTTVLEADLGGPEAMQELLRSALSAGAVREFAAVRPGLVELYRHAVADLGSARTQEQSPRGRWPWGRGRGGDRRA